MLPESPDRDRRKQILQAATAEFAERGFAGARTDRIAAAARVNKQLIHHYFGTKEGLYRAVLRTAADYGEATRFGLANDGDGGAAPSQLVVRLVHALTTHPEYSRIAAWELLEGADPESAPERTRALRRLVERVARQQREGLLTKDVDPDVAVLSVLALGVLPTLLPGFVAAITGENSNSPAFVRRYASQIERMLETSIGLPQTRRTTRATKESKHKRPR